MKRSMPSDEEIGTAVLWLQGNDGGNGESDACRAVADWLLQQSEERGLRTAAREGGVTVAQLRRAVAKQERAKEKGTAT